MRFEHILVSPHDPKLDYAAICEGLFQGRYLAVIEPPKGRQESPMIHVQGETELAATSFEDKIADLITKRHYKRDLPGLSHCRPCKRLKAEVADKGFQMPFRAEAPVASRGLTPEDISALSTEARSTMMSAPAKEAKLDISARVLKQVTKMDSVKPFANFDDAMNAIKWTYVTEIGKNDSKFQSSVRMRTVIWGIAFQFFAAPHRFYDQYKRKLLDYYL